MLSNLPDIKETIEAASVIEKSHITEIIDELTDVKVYRALLSQSGTAAPVATVLENSLGGEIVWTRQSEGVYNGTLADGFVANKTFVRLPSGYDVAGDITTIKYTYIARETNNTIFVSTGTGVDSMADDCLASTPVEIMVYP